MTSRTSSDSQMGKQVFGGWLRAAQSANLAIKSRLDERSATWAALIVLAAVAASLRFYRLESQLWLDEIAALTGGYRRPLLEILTTFPGYFPHPLYELLGRLSLVLNGESASAIRLPAALFGIAGALMFYKLARRLFSLGEAFVATMLIAVSYHHIYYSQYARGYTAYLFFFLAATDLLLSLLDTWRWRTALVYMGLTALAVYSQPFGLFVPAGHVAVALPVAWYRRRRGSTSAPEIGQLVATAAMTALAVAVLYAPFIVDSIQYSLTESRTAGAGPRILQLIPELIEGLLAGFGGWPILLVGTVVAAVGTLCLIRHSPVVLALLIAPILVGSIAAGLLGVGVHPRYFLLALPVAYLVGAAGIFAIAREGMGRTPLSARHRTWVGAALAGLLVVAALQPLMGYYSIPKQDFQGALNLVEDLRAPTDETVAVDLAGHAIDAYYAPNYPVVNNLEELKTIESFGERVWAITTLEVIMSSRVPDLLEHIHEQYELVQVLPGTVGDGAMRIYMREAIDV